MPIVTYDVFLSYSSNDERVVTQLAEQLRRDGLRVWFDKWEILPGDPIGIKIQEGLAKSRILLLGMSNSAFRSDWSVLESQTFLFRDPLNHERRFIPLLLEQAEIPDTIRQFRYVDWRTRSASEYASLLARCKPPEERKPELGHGHLDTGGHLLNRAVVDLSLYTSGTHLLLVALSEGDLLLIERESPGGSLRICRGNPDAFRRSRSRQTAKQRSLARQTVWCGSGVWLPGGCVDTLAVTPRPSTLWLFVRMGLLLHPDQVTDGLSFGMCLPRRPLARFNLTVL